MIISVDIPRNQCSPGYLFTKKTSLPVAHRTHLHPHIFDTFLPKVFNIDYHNMRFSLSSAVGAILVAVSAAAPLVTVSAATSHNVTRDDGASPILHHVLPNPGVKCTGTSLNATEVELAKENAIVWGQEESVPKHHTHGWYEGNAMLWICNCKLAKDDPVRRTELEDALSWIEETCGTNQSGWVYSPKWKKGFGLNTFENFKHASNFKRCPALGCL